LSAASVTVRSAERSGGKVSVDCPPGFGLRCDGPVSVDGAPWPVRNQNTVWLPVGKHTVEPASSDTPFRIVGFNGTLLQARWTGSAAEFEYQSDSRAAALLDRVPGSVRVDGKDATLIPAGDHTTVLLPRGRHK